MSDGRPRQIQDVRVGDRLLGPDGRSRLVTETHRGTAQLVRIIPVKGQPWECTTDHRLTLVSTLTGEFVDVTVAEWMLWTKYQKHLWKLVRASQLELQQACDVTIDPYFLGVLLGDGTLAHRACEVTTMDPEVVDMLRDQAEIWGCPLRMVPNQDNRPSKANTWKLMRAVGTARRHPIMDAIEALGIMPIPSERRFVPAHYKFSSIATRLEVFAGLMDTDGCRTHGGFEYLSKSPQLAGDVAYMARSLGLACYLTTKFVLGNPYYRCSISGDTTHIPCRVPRRKSPPRLQKKSVLRTGFRVEVLDGLRPYAGVTIDGDHRFLLGDFTITHNCGKTVVFTAIVADGLAKGRRILVLAHRDELIEQAAATIEKVIGCAPGIEKGKHRDASQPATLLTDGTGRVVVSSIQTMASRLESIAADSFDLVIRDEAHHCRSASDERVLAHFATAKVLGVTATPNRGDDKALRNVFASVAYDMNILDGISEGWLVPVRQKQVDLPGLDLSKMRKVAGDFSRNQLAEVMEDLDMLRSISAPTVRYLEGRQALVFCVSIKHAELQAESIREVMREYGVDGDVVALDGTAPTEVRKDVVERFRAGLIRVLVNCEIFTEGFDAPSCSMIVMARPTQSKALYLQMLGRGTRPLAGVVDPLADDPPAVRRAAIAASAKPDMLVLDLVGNTGKHDMVHAADMLGGDGDEADIRDAERILERGDTDDLMKAIEMARALRSSRDRAKLARDGDFFALFGLVREQDRWERPMSDAQRDTLSKANIPLVGIDWRGANQAITEIVRRMKAGLCNYKQARVLVRARVPLFVIERAMFTDATAAISRLEAANWRPSGDAWWRDTLARGDVAR